MIDGPRYCVVNVDDFGISEGVNHGVVDAHRASVVTSASLMVNMRHTAHAVALAQANPDLSVGLHVNFTNETGPPIVDLDDVAACRIQLAGQIDCFESLLGRKPTHLDSHHHVHRRAALNRVFAEAANELGVPLRDDPPVRFFGSFYGAWDGESHPEQISVEMLEQMLATFGPGITEFATHVGYVDPSFQSDYRNEREIELRTLLDPRVPQLFDSLSIRRVAFSDLHRLGLR